MEIPQDATFIVNQMWHIDTPTFEDSRNEISKTLFRTILLTCLQSDISSLASVCVSLQFHFGDCV